MKILNLTVQQKQLSTAEAELWVFVHLEAIDATTQLRGFLTGPRCNDVETVEINYPIKPLLRPSEYEEKILVGRIVIPDPNFWTSEMPFVYEGNVEWWHGGKYADSRPIRAAFKLVSRDA